MYPLSIYIVLAFLVICYNCILFPHCSPEEENSTFSKA